MSHIQSTVVQGVGSQCLGSSASVALQGAASKAALTGWSWVPVAFPGWGCKLLVALSFSGLEEGSPFPTSPLGSSLVDISLPHCPSRGSLWGSTHVSGFCPGTQSFWHILWNLGGSFQAFFTFAFCQPEDLTPHGNYQSFRLAPFRAAAQAICGTLWAETGARAAKMWRAGSWGSTGQWHSGFDRQNHSFLRTCDWRGCLEDFWNEFEAFFHCLHFQHLAPFYPCKYL